MVVPILYEIMESWPKKIRRKIMKNNPQEEIDAAMVSSLACFYNRFSFAQTFGTQLLYIVYQHNGIVYYDTFQHDNP